MDTNKVLEVIDQWIDGEYKNLDRLEALGISQEAKDKHTVFIEGMLFALESLYGRIKGELETTSGQSEP
jgi:hypothetical protein